MITVRKRDRVTAAALGVSCDFFIQRRALLRKQAEAQGAQRKVFRILPPVVSEILTRMKDYCGV